MRHLDRRFRNYLLLKVAVWGLAYLAIGGYSHHQARAVREDTLGTQVKFLEIYLAVVNVTFPPGGKHWQGPYWGSLHLHHMQCHLFQGVPPFGEPTFNTFSLSPVQFTDHYFICLECSTFADDCGRVQQLH